MIRAGLGPQRMGSTISFPDNVGVQKPECVKFSGTRNDAPRRCRVAHAAPPQQTSKICDAVRLNGASRNNGWYAGPASTTWFIKARWPT